MILDKNLIPPQPGMPFRINRKFPPLEKLSVVIPAQNVPFEKSAKIDAKRRLLINSFDASVSRKVTALRKVSKLTKNRAVIAACLLKTLHKSLQRSPTREHII